MIYFLSLVLILLTANGCRTIHPMEHRMAQTSAPDEILASDMSFNSATGEIRYTLPQDALVRIRIGLAGGGPLLAHPVDWEFQKKGKHVETWNKKDATGKVDFGDRSEYMLVLACLPVDEKERRNYQTDIKGFRKSPEPHISFPESKVNNQGIPVISGVVPVRITLDEKDKDWLTKTRYEIGMYVDYIFLLEDEEGVNPFTYQFNTAGLNSGLHKITVNIVGYEGEVGTQTVLVEVR